MEIQSNHFLNDRYDEALWDNKFKMGSKNDHVWSSMFFNLNPFRWLTLRYIDFKCIINTKNKEQK